MDFLSNQVEIVKNILSEVIVWIIILIFHFCFNIVKCALNKRKKIKIQADTRNVSKILNGQRLVDNKSDEKELKNYIENELVIENPKDNIFIKDLKISILKVEEYLYEDIVIQSGFANNTQIVDFVVLNNGTRKSDRKKYSLRGFYLNKEKDTEERIFQKDFIITPLKSGGIRKIFSKKLTEPDITRYFEKFFKDYKQIIKIELLEVETNKILTCLEIPYLSSSQQFCRNLGSGPIYLETPILPMIKLYKESYEREFVYSINKDIARGTEKLYFHIIVDYACKIKYQILLLDKSGKQLASCIVPSIKIQFPVYKLQSQYKDEFYHYLNNYKLEESDKDEVRHRENSLLNSIQKTMEEYNISHDE